MLDESLQFEDTPVSADVLHRLRQDGALTIDDVADLFNIKPQSVYPYLDVREMRYSQVRTLIRRSLNRRVAEAFFNDLMQGIGWSAIYIDTQLDFDGDGDVDSDDVLGHGIDAMRQLSEYLQLVKDTGKPDMELLGRLNQRAMQSMVKSERCAAHLADNNDRRGGRRKARPVASGGVA